MKNYFKNFGRNFGSSLSHALASLRKKIRKEKNVKEGKQGEDGADPDIVKLKVASVGITMNGRCSHQSQTTEAEMKSSPDSEKNEKIGESSAQTIHAKGKNPDVVGKERSYDWITCMRHKDKILAMLHEQIDKKTKPKDILLPLRCAVDAGVIRKPTWSEFCEEFGSHKLKSKASLSYHCHRAKVSELAVYKFLKKNFLRLTDT